MVKLIIEWPNGLAVSDTLRVNTLVSETGGKGLFVAPGSASDNTQSAGVAKIAAEMGRTVETRIKACGDSTWSCDVAKWARQLRAL